jgi:diguanylate cyclase (GGDEF)-like protein/PAS domain S-box-containing protein
VKDIELQDLLTKAINEASPQGILVVDADGIVVSHNRRFLEVWRILGDFPQEGSVVGIGHTSLLMAVSERLVDYDAFAARMQELYDNPHLDDCCEIKLRDGRTLERHFTVLRGNDGQYLGRVWFFLDITALKQIEDRLHINQLVNDHAPDCIIWVDEQARIIYANAAACREYGYTRDELLAKTVIDIDYGARKEGWPDHWRMLQQKGSVTFETRHQRKDGSIFLIESSVNYIQFEGRELAVGFFRNITERKQAEIALQWSERHLKQAQAIAHVGSWDLNLATGEIQWTDELHRIFGIPPENFIPSVKTYNDLIHPDDRAIMHASMSALIAGHKPGADVWRCIRPDGTLRYINGQGELILDAEGNPSHLSGTAQDITERKQAEEKLLITQFVSDHAPDSIFWIDEQARIVYVNEAACRERGYTREELLAMSIPDLNSELPVDVWRGQWQRAQQKGQLVFESRHRRKDGSIFPIEVSANFVQFGGKEVVVAYVRNITQRKKNEDELRIAAVAFESQEILMITNAEGVILRVNHAFTENTGYTAEEAVGHTPRIFKSGRHDAAFYRDMWEAIKNTGKWQGEIWDKRKNGEIYPKWLSISAVKNSDGIVTHYVASHIDITERKAAEEEIQHLAFYDALTKLPNRRLLMDRLQHAIASSARSGRRGALLFIDLDHFKTLNDTLGHDIGDLLLQQVAQRLVSCMREGDTVARLGGDEFMLILEGLDDQPVEAAAQTEAASEKILTALSQPYLLAGHESRSTPSIGATIFIGHQVSLEELMKQADIAMYQSKKAGRHTMRFFDPEMQATINAHAALENELRLAIENRDFQLYYQVQVDSSQRVLGVEALIRWRHPELGMISPPQFIMLAEESGLILHIGRWVMDTACAQLKSWQDDPLTRDLVIAVNVSPKRFRQADFAAEVQATVTRHAIDPKLLKLELTENLLLENIEEVIKTMGVLNDIGVRLSLDDFGTGYSSLQYLKRLPLNQLKIDQSFVRDLASDSSDKAIVKTIIAMAQSLDLNVIAEGVETAEQRQILLDMGCKSFQGYLFSKPLPVEKFEAVLKQG